MEKVFQLLLCFIVMQNIQIFCKYFYKHSNYFVFTCFFMKGILVLSIGDIQESAATSFEFSFDYNMSMVKLSVNIF